MIMSNSFTQSQKARDIVINKKNDMSFVSLINFSIIKKGIYHKPIRPTANCNNN